MKNIQLQIENDPLHNFASFKETKCVLSLVRNNKFYRIRIIPVDGPEDGTGNYQLLVSVFVDHVNDLDKSAADKYVRTNLGKRPW